MPPLKFVCHSKTAIDIARRGGWFAGARYTNLRDVRHVSRVGFIDVDWKSYNFRRHLDAVRSIRPCMTVALDIKRRTNLARILDQAEELRQHACSVVIVPKVVSLGPALEEIIPKHFIFGFSVPTRYGGTRISPKYFRRGVHLLGGRPDTQRDLADRLRVISIDGNRFTLDAAFGDYFDGETFRPHPSGGYKTCLKATVLAVNELWSTYPPVRHRCTCGLLAEIAT